MQAPPINIVRASGAVNGNCAPVVTLAISGASDAEQVKIFSFYHIIIKSFVQNPLVGMQIQADPMLAAVQNEDAEVENQV